MGNAASITVHYPSTLEAEIRLLSGELLEKTQSTIRIGKRDGAAEVGCGERVTFKKGAAIYMTSTQKQGGCLKNEQKSEKNYPKNLQMRQRS